MWSGEFLGMGLNSLKFLFDGKSIRKERGTVNEKNRVKGKGTKGAF